jgi:hypothetical protein
MPAPNQVPPAASPAPVANNAGYFIPQPSTTPAASVSESPVLTSPANSGRPAAAGVPGTPNPSRKKLLIGAGIAVLVLAIVGAGTGFYLSRTNEDTRQQASTPTGSASLTLTPTSGTFEGGSVQQVDFQLNLTTSPVTFSAIEFSVDFTGQLPDDLEFEPADLQNFGPAFVSLEETEAGQTLSVTYEAIGSQGFSATSNQVNLGTLNFTTPLIGQMTLRFNASESKALLQQSNVDILRPPSLVAYEFEAPSQTLDVSEVDNASTSANELLEEFDQQSIIDLDNDGIPDNQTLLASTNEEASEESNEVLENNLVDDEDEIAPPPALEDETPTLTPALLAQANITDTPTPTATPARQSSLPAETQEKPVSGSASFTITLLGSGLLLMIAGAYLTSSPVIRANNT